MSTTLVVLTRAVQNPVARRASLFFSTMKEDDRELVANDPGAQKTL